MIKKRWCAVILALLIIFLLPSAFSYEMTNIKSSYLPRETFQAELTGNFSKPFRFNMAVTVSVLFKPPRRHTADRKMILEEN